MAGTLRYLLVGLVFFKSLPAARYSFVFGLGDLGLKVVACGDLDLRLSELSSLGCGDLDLRPSELSSLGRGDLDLRLSELSSLGRGDLDLRSFSFFDLDESRFFFFFFFLVVPESLLFDDREPSSFGCPPTVGL